MSGFIGMPSLRDIERIDQELDRIRWYVAKLAVNLSDDEGYAADQIIRMLKTGYWEAPA
jgi:hypothetical protein